MTSAAAEIGRTTPRVLIVDDERVNRQLLEVMLAEEGYELQTATSGAEALSMIAARVPDLVLLDVMMPGMNGYQVAASIRGNPATAGVRVVILTALDDRSSEAHGRSSGADAFLTKPVNRAALCECVRKLLRPVG